MKKVKVSMKFFVLIALVLAICSLAACGVGAKELVDFAVDGGGKYTGTAVDGKPTGEGTIKYDNGNTYEGSVVDGKPSGSGVMVDVISEGTYTGKFALGKYSDPVGKMEFDNGGLYDGAFDGGKMKGEGKFTWPDGNVYTGTFDGTGGAEGGCGAINGNGAIAFVGGINYVGKVVNGFPNVGMFAWPGGIPTFTGTFNAFLTGYGALDMGNGIIYNGTMGLGLLVPIDSYTGDIVITYPENTDYKGETFTGKYVHNTAENKDELIGTVKHKDNTTIENVKVALDWSFSYRYTGTFTDKEIVYTGEMRDNNVPFGKGVYQWPNINDPTFTATENHGWLTGYGVLDMHNGITYEGPLNGIAAAKSGTEFQPYTKFDGKTVDDVKIVHPAGTFTGKLTDMGTGNLSSAAKLFFANATYLSEGVFNDGTNDIPFLFVPSFAFGLYPISTSTIAAPVIVAGLQYVGKYITVIDGTTPTNFAFGKGVTYWTAVDGAPRIESEFFYNNMTGIVKFVQTGYTYEGGMNLMSFAPECGQTAAKITFDNGDMFNGEWKEGVLTGKLILADKTEKNVTINITLTTCTYTEIDA